MRVSFRHFLFVLYALLLVFSMRSCVWAVIRFAMDWNNSEASQILLIPLISVSLICINRRNIFHTVDYSLLPGGIIIALGLLLFVSSERWVAHLAYRDQ